MIGEGNEVFSRLSCKIVSNKLSIFVQILSSKFSYHFFLKERKFSDNYFHSDLSVLSICRIFIFCISCCVMFNVMFLSLDKGFFFSFYVMLVYYSILHPFHNKLYLHYFISKYFISFN